MFETDRIITAPNGKIEPRSNCKIQIRRQKLASDPNPHSRRHVYKNNTIETRRQMKYIQKKVMCDHLNK